MQMSWKNHQQKHETQSQDSDSLQNIPLSTGSFMLLGCQTFVISVSRKLLMVMPRTGHKQKKWKKYGHSISFACVHWASLPSRLNFDVSKVIYFHQIMHSPCLNSLIQEENDNNETEDK